MKIIKVLMERKMENEQMLKKALRKQFAYEEHISIYLMALFYLGLNDPLLSRKKIWWKKLLSAVINKNINHQYRYYKRLLKYKQEEDGIIIMALNKIEEEKGKSKMAFGTMYRPFTWGVLSYEYHSED